MKERGGGGGGPIFFWWGGTGGGGGGTYFFCVWRDMQQTTENMFFQEFKSLGYILHEHM